MDGLTAFGLLAVTAMMVCYALERRSHWFVLGFAGACGLGSAYGFFQGAWPFGVDEAVWMIVALCRWTLYRRQLAAVPVSTGGTTGYPLQLTL